MGELMRTKVEAKDASFNLVEIFFDAPPSRISIVLSQKEALSLFQQLSSLNFKPHEILIHHGKSEKLRQWLENHASRLSLHARMELDGILKEYEYLSMKFKDIDYADVIKKGIEKIEEEDEITAKEKSRGK